MQDILQFMDVAAGRLAEVAKSDVVVGEPIQLGKATVVPLSRVALSLGGGGGEGEGSAPQGKKEKGGAGGRGVSAGAGGGAKVRPVAVAVFTEAGVEIVPIPDKKGAVERLLDRIPDLVERVQEVVRDKE